MQSRIGLFTIWFAGLLLFVRPAHAEKPAADTLDVPGLQKPVTIYKDPWGISHIFAQTQWDLFFAQGYNAARDRLFQLELWRRRALGRFAEILGRRALQHDIGARLLKFRGDLDAELRHYHPDGPEIIHAFVAGINAYIDWVNAHPEALPLEFRLLGIRPEHWTPEVVISRHNGLFYGLRQEIRLAQAVSRIGADTVLAMMDFRSSGTKSRFRRPKLAPRPGLDFRLITEKVMELYRAARTQPAFLPEDIVLPEYRAAFTPPELLRNPAGWPEFADMQRALGSNNWVVRGERTAGGYPVMANDPHRSLQIPSLRYWVHLNGPGWNVIGGGEPALPGVSIGHNEHGAWGLTIFRIDQEDLYVYDTHPDDPNQYRYRGRWEPMRLVKETIPVKGEGEVEVTLKYTRHGPVLYEDREHRKAYALRAAWLEIGTAPYLASLRMDQADSWAAFREACSYSGTPPENMVWADRDGNIGWQAVGFLPLREGWEGLLPVPGDGRYEWRGYLPIPMLPHVSNPPEGFWATANQNNVPPGYPFFVSYLWSEPFRYHRIVEVLGGSRKLTLADHMALQLDEVSLPARSLVPLLKPLRANDRLTQRALETLLQWDYRMSAESVAAAIYFVWERTLAERILELKFGKTAAAIGRKLGAPARTRLIEWLLSPDGSFGKEPLAGRDRFLLQCLEAAVSELRQRLGRDMRRWRYGQANFKHVAIRHVLSGAVNAEVRKQLDVGPLPRGGYAYTVNNTSNALNQRAGATFRIIADTGDWDRSLGSNAPGQSGNPADPHYRDLFPKWARGQYFPVYFSREKIENVAERVWVLRGR